MGEYYTTYFAKKCRAEGREEGLRIGREEGLQIGREKGLQIAGEVWMRIGKEIELQTGMQQDVQPEVMREIQQAANRLGNLICALIEKGRKEDVERSLKDKEYRKELFKEFGL